MKDEFPSLDSIDIYDALDKHGYFFELACQKVISKNDKYSLLSSNYPIKIDADHESDIDVIAVSNRAFPTGTILICEFKREEPSLKKWVFSSRDPLPHYIMTVLFTRSDNDFQFTPSHSPSATPIFNMGFSIGSNKKGQTSCESEIIWTACRQVVRGVDHFITDILHDNVSKEMFSAQARYYIRPLLVTTAKLYSFATNVDSIDLTSGKISDNGCPEKSEKWVNYKWCSASHYYNDKLNWQNSGGVYDLKEFNERYQTFDITIVTAEHLEELLRSW